MVRFHSPYIDEDPNQLYVTLEVVDYDDYIVVDIIPLNLDNRLFFRPINTVKYEDLEVVAIGTEDLIGYYVSVTKPDGSQSFGKIISVQELKIFADLDITSEGVETNIWATILDIRGKEHSGYVFLKL